MLIDTVDRLQDEGKNIYIWGWSPDVRKALVVNHEDGIVTVADYGSQGTLGRWECSTGHFSANIDVYISRFPVRWPED